MASSAPKQYGRQILLYGGISIFAVSAYTAIRIKENAPRPLRDSLDISPGSLFNKLADDYDSTIKWPEWSLGISWMRWWLLRKAKVGDNLAPHAVMHDATHRATCWRWLQARVPTSATTSPSRSRASHCSTTLLPCCARLLTRRATCALRFLAHTQATRLISGTTQLWCRSLEI